VSFEFPVTIAVAQLAVLLLVGMLVARIARMVLGQVYERELEEGSQLIQAWLDGNADDDDIGAKIANLSDDTFVAIVRSYSGIVEGGRWEDLVTLLRGTHWFAGVKRRATSPLWWRRLDSARALALLARDAEAGLARDLLADRHHAVRLAAVRILKRLPDRDMLRRVFDEAIRAAPVLQGYLFDVLQSHDRAVVDVVLERLRGVDDAEAVSAAVRYVEQVADPIYMDAILEVVDHPMPLVRVAAARAVAVFPHKRSAKALGGRLDDNDPDVREAVCEALGTIGAVESVEALMPRLGDASWRVRMAACVALRRLGMAGTRILREVAQQVEGNADDRLARYVLSLEPDALLEHSASMGMG
jgi:hypothetical protein